MPARPATPTQRLFFPPSIVRAIGGIAFAVAGSLLAVEVAMLSPMERFPTVPFFVAVVGATLIGRLAAGLIAVAGAVLLLDLEFVPPIGSIAPTSWENLVGLGAFGLITLGIAFVVARRDVASAFAESERDRFAFLTEAGDALSTNLDYESRLQEVARVAVPRLADWCSVIVAEAGGLRTVAVAHVDPAKVAWAQELQVQYPPHPDAPTGAPAVIRTGRPEMMRRIPRKLLKQFGTDPERKRLLKQLGLRSVIVVPIEGRGRTLGALTLVMAESKRRFGPGDLALAMELGSRAGLAVENSRLYRERDHIAATLQRALLPPALPEIEGFEIRAFYRPASAGVHAVGGDFYDVFPVSGNAWMLVMGDACGKGAEAAALTGLVRYTARALAARESSPAEILDGINDTLLRSAEGEEFSTVAVVRVEPTRDGGRITTSVGGHPRPAVLRRNGAIAVLGEPGVLVGAFEDAKYANANARILRGETLVMYTDGLTSKDEGDALADNGRLRRALEPLANATAEDIVAAIEDHVARRTEGDPNDDVAVLALRSLPARARSAPTEGDGPPAKATASATAKTSVARSR
jgi:serine phosphatase RsbU (regulator of sigma subunit)